MALSWGGWVTVHWSDGFPVAQLAGGLGHVGSVNRWNMMESPAVHIETAGIHECSSRLVQALIGKRKVRAGAAPCVASSKTATKPQSWCTAIDTTRCASNWRPRQFWLLGRHVSVCPKIWVLNKGLTLKVVYPAGTNLDKDWRDKPAASCSSWVSDIKKYPQPITGWWF